MRSNPTRQTRSGSLFPLGGFRIGDYTQQCPFVQVQAGKPGGFSLIEESEGARDGLLELNVMMPMMAHNFLESVWVLSNVATVFAEKCVAGIEADRERCEEMIEKSLAMCTSLAPVIGYDKAAAIAKEAYASGRTVREVALEQQVCSAEQLAAILDAGSMTRPG